MLVFILMVKLVAIMNKNYNDNISHIVLKSLLYLAMGVFFIFFVVNIARERFLLASIEGILCVINVVLLLNFKDIISSEQKIKVILPYSLLLLSTLMMVFLHGSVNDLTYLWIFIIPFIGYTINNVKIGVCLTMIFNIIGFSIYFFRNQFEVAEPNYTQFINMLSSMFAIWFLIHIYEKNRWRLMNKLEQLSIIDPLTKLKNREQLYKIYHEYTDKMMSLAIIDIDCIGNINDKFGYLAGDVVLINVANAIKHHKLVTEKNTLNQAFRIGDDEFAILIPEKDAEECLPLIRELFVEMVSEKTVYRNQVIEIKLSIALASIQSNGNNFDELLRTANKLLRQAKNSNTDKIAVSV